MSNSKARSRAKRARSISRTGKAVAIYHEMLVQEDFNRCAQRLHLMLLKAQQTSPNAPRLLYLDIQGHRNLAGGFDADAFELMNEFTLMHLGKYLTKINTPLIHAVNTLRQRNDIPSILIIDANDHTFDHVKLTIRAREERDLGRKSPPSAQAVADYLGMLSPECLICGKVPVQRAHAVPKALGGSYDIRNFALLCAEHHEQAPDVADAEAFWAWIDLTSEEHSRDLWQTIRGLADDMSELSEKAIGKSHFAKVKKLLIAQHGWTERQFNEVSFDQMMDQFYQVLQIATGTHFDVTRKASTEAWAYDTAWRRINDPGNLDFPTG